MHKKIEFVLDIYIHTYIYIFTTTIFFELKYFFSFPMHTAMFAIYRGGIDDIKNLTDTNIHKSYLIEVVYFVII